ncbi:MAG: pleD [Vampirovibrio sp.]|nr:pleD [Vampirovibrio sp.]
MHMKNLANGAPYKRTIDLKGDVTKVGMMDSTKKSQPTDITRITSQNAEAGQVAMRSSLSATQGDVLLNALLAMRQIDASSGKVLVGGDWTLKELECAREFNFELPTGLPAAVTRMELAVRNVMGVRHCVILVFNEQTGLYNCLGDLARMQGPVRELPNVSDGFLQDLLETDGEVLQAGFSQEGGLCGLVAVAGKDDGKPFTHKDQMLLELLAPYLAGKVARFVQLRQSQTLPYVQGAVLDLAARLVTAVDQDAIITALLETFVHRLGFDACQYVGFNPENGFGEVLYDIRKPAGNLQTAKVQSYSHAGQEGKRRTVREFSNLVGLLSSMARNRFYLHLNGKKLGDRSLSEIFGIRSIQSALLLPVADVATGEIRGTFNLFHTTDALISDEAREIARESVQLASQALSRALVLEKALAMASSDELTGLINRRGYYQRFESELERARRHQTSLCVALIDVDHFKKFNDTYGHLSGDLVLKALAELFSHNLRKSDVVCRFGGEEFAILLPDTGLKSAVELMERVRQSVEKLQLYGINGELLKVTISVGLAEVNTRPKASARQSEISEALAIADEQLYRAKEKGRNRVCIPCDETGATQQAG